MSARNGASGRGSGKRSGNKPAAKRTRSKDQRAARKITSLNCTKSGRKRLTNKITRRTATR